MIDEPVDVGFEIAWVDRNSSFGDDDYAPESKRFAQSRP
jgi:hypothetical protein